MNDQLDSFSRLLSDVILPNLKSVQTSQAEQIAANDRLEIAIDELRLHMESRFSQLAALLTACRAELAATQAILKAAQSHGGLRALHRSSLIH